MAKAYILTEADFADLHRRLELTHLRSHDKPDTLDQIKKSDLFRSFNYHIHSWINDVQKG